jgi:ferredoxin-fold anticodon binding domain-containing protein
MSAIGFTIADVGVQNVFIDNEHIGVIREVKNKFMFTPGKKRLMMNASVLRAIAVKIETMEMNHE